jgi:hypothetical protein
MTGSDTATGHEAGWVAALVGLERELDELAVVVAGTWPTPSLAPFTPPADLGPLPDAVRRRAEAALTRLRSLEDAAGLALERVQRELGAVESLGAVGPARPRGFDASF